MTPVGVKRGGPVRYGSPPGKCPSTFCYAGATLALRTVQQGKELPKNRRFALRRIENLATPSPPKAARLSKVAKCVAHNLPIKRTNLFERIQQYAAANDRILMPPPPVPAVRSRIFKPEAGGN
jgi:hypothetical protein